MFDYLRQKQAKKQELVQRVKADKAKLKERKIEIAAMPEAERNEAIKRDKQLRNEAAEQIRLQMKSMGRKERKAMKKEAKRYRKIKNRPRRFAGWSIVAVVIIFIIVQVGPTAGAILEALSGKHITAVTNTPEGVQARAHGEKMAEEIANEGIVLLKNSDQNLPLQDKKVNVFGVAALHMRYGGGGSGGGDTSRAVNLFDGLKNAGIAYNTHLYDMYQKVGGGNSGGGSGLVQVAKGLLGMNSSDEPKIDYLTDDAIKQAKGYSNQAVIVLASESTEASDASVEQLKLTANKRALVEKVAQSFDNVTIIVNAGNALELGFVEEFKSIKSVVWIGTPGPYGANSLGNILAGNINPSGRITDTYVYDNSSAPASENFGSYKYNNLNYAFMNYQEGIYVGYRFYETFYANDEAGYKKAVLYPYGHGLSYTNFEWTVKDQKLSDQKMEVQVEVKNVGKVAGKDVVQLYYSTPYTPGGIEKAAIELGAYGKTSLLEPGQSEVLTLTFNTEDMASYDMNKEQAYVLEQGNYVIKVARNVHDIVASYDYKLADKIVYKKDKDTGTEYKNQFDSAKGELTYLSRNDWKGTYPSDANISHDAPQYVLDAFTKEIEPSTAKMPTFGADNGIKLKDLKGLAFNDPKWDSFLDQFTLDEMFKYVTNAAYRTMAVERLGVPKTLLMDGPAGFSYFFKPVTAASYPSEIVIASTWNDDLAYRMGEAAGKEARAYGIQGWYAPGMNIHRTAQGGRNFEYFSEDPVLSGKIAAAMTKGAQDQGIIVFIKHFAMNDQETNARSGNLIWANEQAIREIYLKPFEIAVKDAKPLAAMSSFSIIGMKWAGANSILLNDILRKEWGFDGFVSSDAVFGFMHAKDAVVAGNDLMLDIMSPNKNEKGLKDAYKKDPSGIANGVRTSVHHVLYTILRTHLFES
ncbi:glycoside hydrolase family 3 C-terminal domain-containing protein [Paenibacillus sp. N1-5-1-14]|uniref:glycoside hydrolase family 3 N-terminal domain-containing protein n=1 Tax=Paenibacillus radicibacter TaxID=2972488 RepID=UPI0021591752|nr:glycoside hydrolase family 3 N-terminal domain-containing protein [Paenibacillus radicibacter]MCR8644275.1 glycoside hydrolase family 3 C-terminal domain-containing protein [Paenibacillus radicibacter]